MSAIIDATTAPFSLSLLTATRGNASKRLVPNAHGYPIRDPEHSLAISTGRVEHVQVAGLAGLGEFLQHVTHKQALVHGVPKGSKPGDMLPLVTSAQVTKHPSAIARTLEFFDYPPGVRLVMFDIDPDPEAPSVIRSAADLMTRLRQVFPAFVDVGWLATVSTTSAIRDKQSQAWLRPPAGFHVYLLVTGDVARFRDLARVRLWLSGTGFCKLAKPHTHTGVAAVLERCLIDLAVFSPERLDYVAGALIAKHAPFEQVRPAPELHPGTVLNLDALPDVTPEEITRYEALVTEAKARLAPERVRVVRERIRATTPDLSAETVEREVAQRLGQADRCELALDHPLVFSNKQHVTVAHLSAAYDGKRLADPFEPDYGLSHAIFHWRGGDWRIVSWAHGITKVYQATRLVPPRPYRQRVFARLRRWGA